MSIESGEMVQINTLWWTQINSRSTIRSNLLFFFLVLFLSLAVREGSIPSGNNPGWERVKFYFSFLFFFFEYFMRLENYSTIEVKICWIEFEMKRRGFNVIKDSEWRSCWAEIQNHCSPELKIIFRFKVSPLFAWFSTAG